MILQPEPPRIALVVEPRPDPALRAAVERAIAAVGAPWLLLTQPREHALDIDLAKPLVTVAQALNAAALIEADTRLARKLGADGVHLPWSKDQIAVYTTARGDLGNGLVVGADAGRSRDDAMMLGEQGADYVGFGVPPHVKERDAARARRDELVQWWAEIFEVPVVAFDVETADEAANLAAAGADFIAVRIPPGIAPAEIESWATEFAAAIKTTEPVE